MTKQCLSEQIVATSQIDVSVLPFITVSLMEQGSGILDLDLAESTFITTTQEIGAYMLFVPV